MLVTPAPVRTTNRAPLVVTKPPWPGDTIRTAGAGVAAPADVSAVKTPQR
jgi:hypothetical protein